MAGYEKTSGGNGRDMVAWRPCIWRSERRFRRAGDFTWSARNWRGGQRARGNGRDMKAWRAAGSSIGGGIGGANAVSGAGHGGGAILLPVCISVDIWE